MGENVLIIGPKDRVMKGRTFHNPKEPQSHFLRGGRLQPRKAATLPVN